jgi:hypothetical protein
MVTTEAESMLTEYYTASSVMFDGDRNQGVRNVVKWENPPVGYSKINWDVNFFKKYINVRDMS